MVGRRLVNYKVGSLAFGSVLMAIFIAIGISVLATSGTNHPILSPTVNNHAATISDPHTDNSTLKTWFAPVIDLLSEKDQVTLAKPRSPIAEPAPAMTEEPQPTTNFWLFGFLAVMALITGFLLRRLDSTRS